MPRIYETVLVLKPTLDENQVDDAVDVVKKLLEKNSAKIINEVNWGKKKLAYEIQNYKKAYYFLLNFEAEVETIRKLDRHCRLSEDIIRSMTIILKSKALKEFQKTLKTRVTQEENANGEGGQWLDRSYS